MQAVALDPAQLRGAWQWRASGCMGGKPLAALPFEQGISDLVTCLQAAQGIEAGRAA